MTVATFEEYKEKYHEVKALDPMNPELEEIKKDYLKGVISKGRAVEQMEELKQKILEDRKS